MPQGDIGLLRLLGLRQSLTIVLPQAQNLSFQLLHQIHLVLCDHCLQIRCSQVELFLLLLLTHYLLNSRSRGLHSLNLLESLDRDFPQALVFKLLILQHIPGLLQFRREHLLTQLVLPYLVSQMLDVQHALLVVSLCLFFRHPLKHHRVFQVSKLVLLHLSHLVVQLVIVFCHGLPVLRRIFFFFPRKVQCIRELFVLLAILIILRGQLLARLL